MTTLLANVYLDPCPNVTNQPDKTIYNGRVVISNNYRQCHFLKRLKESMPSCNLSGLESVEFLSGEENLKTSAHSFDIDRKYFSVC